MLVCSRRARLESNSIFETNNIGGGYELLRVMVTLKSPVKSVQTAELVGRLPALIAGAAHEPEMLLLPNHVLHGLLALLGCLVCPHSPLSWPGQHSRIS